MVTNNNDVLKVVGEKIKELRTENNVSQKDLASQLGCGQTIITYWEKGEREIKATTVNQICEIFNVTPNYLMGYEDTIGINENEIVRFHKVDMEVLKAVQSNREFMKYAKDNPEQQIKDMIKLWKSVSGIMK